MSNIEYIGLFYMVSEPGTVEQQSLDGHRELRNAQCESPLYLKHQEGTTALYRRRLRPGQ